MPFSTHNADGSQPAPKRGVLVVDDDFIQREWLTRILTRAGESPIFSAENGNEALAQLAEHAGHIGLIICDLQMPGMDGMELLRRIGDMGYRSGIIISSASDTGITRSVELMVKAIGLHVLGTLPKPVTAAMLQKLLTLDRAPALGRQTDSGFQPAAADVEHALNAGEIVPYFQPKVNLATGVIAGIEALARWKHPIKGIVDPGVFLPVVETLGKLPQLTSSIARASIQHAAQWKNRGIALTLNINLSLTALDNRMLCDDFKAMLVGTPLEPRDVTFEILETAAMIDVGRTLETMTRLRLNGFGLAIDDFGTGFSSFEQLSSIPFTELKIDRSFVHGAGNTPRLAAVVRSCIDLAHRLNLKVVAEGVENQDDWNFLAQAGAHEAQGYLIAKPMPAEAFYAWAADWQAAHGHSALSQAG